MHHLLLQDIIVVVVGPRGLTAIPSSQIQTLSGIAKLLILTTGQGEQLLEESLKKLTAQRSHSADMVTDSPLDVASPAGQMHSASSPPWLLLPAGHGIHWAVLRK